MSLQNLSELSCIACRSRKRRCDRLLPNCSHCLKKGISCDYSPKHVSKQRRNTDLLRHQRTFQQSPSAAPAEFLTRNQTATPLGVLPERPTDFPPVIFLDSQVAVKYSVESHIADLPIPSYIHSIIGDISHSHDISKSFFNDIHEWIPIISKKRYYEHLNPLCPLRADYALLTLCMDLISWIPGSQVHDSRTSTYFAAKKFYFELEFAGILSIQILQAGILIATYEIGHAIYPAAFMSVASCARYSSALGLGWSTASSRETSTCWVDSEERSRVWWAIVLLDRIVNIGRPEHSLLIPNPGVDVVLPGNDEEWDQGINCSKTMFSMITPTLEIGDLNPFALICHATRLLGLVLEHLKNSPSLDEQEALLLDRTLRALSQVVDVEGQLRDLHMMNQQAICSIALLLLHEGHASLPLETETSKYMASIHHIKMCNSHVSESLEAATERPDKLAVGTCVKEGSPFLITLLYQGGCVLQRLQRECPSGETLGSLKMANMVLGIFDTRWKSASACQKILEAREMLYTR